MYLKRITIKGFKSFADKTIFDLDKGITGVVGPNGSGKSNVVDAIRWVLGEQSTKSLRASDAMADVIFAGSKSRSKSNQAYVVITFDNTDKFINSEFNEIELKRQVYQDGTNEYFINNNKCRLKDITEFLIDSNIGKESFNIISQGKIEDILSTKPGDRRLVFEDAAGVLKYKKRKEEATRKLDKTSSNIDRINDIINELEVQVEPLKEQAEKAAVFNELNEELREIEVALISYDITELNKEYQALKTKISELKESISLINFRISKDDANILNLKMELEKIDEEIKLKNKELLNISSLVEQTNTKRLMIKERAKYEASDIKIHSLLENAKEKESSLINEIELINIEINKLLNDKKQIELENQNIDLKIKDLTNERINYENELKTHLRDKNNINATIESLLDRINNNSSLPSSVSSLLNNPKITGIYGTIGSLIEIDNSYEEAINTSLGAAVSYLVVENENVAKESVNYLKEKKEGRASFLPLNIIRPKYINNEVLERLKNINGYLGLASNFVKCEPKFKNIIENQLGNIIVTDSLENANIIAKLINYTLRIVTITGEIIHTGGMITGGTNKFHNIITDKQNLSIFEEKSKNILDKIKTLEEKINEIDYKVNELQNKKQISFFTNLIESINSKEKAKLNNEEILRNVKNEINDLNNKTNNTLSKAEEEITLEYQKLFKEKEMLNLDLNNLNKNRSSLYSELNSLELSVKKDNSRLNEETKEYNECEIRISKIDIKLDNLLNNLSENYNMTYEKACNYKLEDTVDNTRTKVNNLKRKIKDLGQVNIGSNEIYEQLKTRYEFLLKQREDLVEAENMLLEVIEEMDKVMAEEFVKTFEAIRENFKVTFRELFKGGEADLKLTDPNDVLNTGIDIIAYPPGKKLGKTVFLSGGEKTFTAISILFAIIKTKQIPFCIFDEVEAALDEANVVSFGKYVQGLKENTQFIIITHKKKTMEYADSLYGVTMQESGVSKLVSVKLKV